jgi:glycosyltransferase involved in cell wall biosynthesis
MTRPIRPFRILIVEACEDGTVGGSHQALYDLATQLDRRFFEPVVLFYQNNRFADQLRSRDVTVFLYETERAVERAAHDSGRLTGKLRSVAAAPIHRVRFLRRHRIDLVHLNNSPAIGYDDWLPAARLVGIPCVAHSCGPYRAPHRAFWRWLACRHDRVIAVSEYVRNTLTGAGMPADRIRLIRPGVDIDGFRARVGRHADDIRRELGIRRDSLLALMVGNLRHWKGQDIALAALARMRPEIRSRLHLLFVGGTSPGEQAFAAELVATVRREKLEQHVTFLGACTDVPNLVNSADFIIHASRVPEPFGLVIVEGMALGKPVIATHFGGPAEILTSDSGVLYDPQQPAELATRISALADDPELRARLGAGAKQRAREFDAARTTAAIEELYRELLPIPRVTAADPAAS